MSGPGWSSSELTVQLGIYCRGFLAHPTPRGCCFPRFSIPSFSEEQSYLTQPIKALLQQGPRGACSEHPWAVFIRGYPFFLPMGLWGTWCHSDLRDKDVEALQRKLNCVSAASQQRAIGQFRFLWSQSWFSVVEWSSECRDSDTPVSAGHVLKFLPLATCLHFEIYLLNNYF